LNTAPQLPKRTLLRRKWWLIPLVLAVAELWHPWVWVSLPVKGHVTDAKTHHPIAGAVIAGNWSLRGPFSDNPVAHLKLAETVSDVHGAFVLPGWIAAHIGYEYLPGRVPELWVLRRGYVGVRAGNRGVLASDARPIITTPEQNIELVSAADVPLGSYRDEVQSVMWTLVTEFTSTHCALLRLPLLLGEWGALRTDLAARGMETSALVDDQTFRAEHCS